jgi:hypothetical protein
MAIQMTRELDLGMDTEAITYYKLFNEEETHHGYPFSTGFHEDPNQFFTDSPCSSGGFYFCREKHLPLWVYYRSSWIRPVTLPPGALVHDEGTKLKANQIILGERMRLRDFLATKSYEYVYRFIKASYIPPDTCLVLLYGIPEKMHKTHMVTMLLQKNPTEGPFIGDMYPYFDTESTWKNAIKAFPTILLLNEVQDPTLVLWGIENVSGEVVWPIKNQTEEMCRAAVQKDGLNIRYIQDKNRTPALCQLALKKNPAAKQYIDRPFRKCVILETRE